MREDESLNEISGDIVTSAIQVHRRLGPGLLESTYEACLRFELERRGHRSISQLALPIQYDMVRLDVGYRIDLLVDDAVIVELKCVEQLLPIHRAQLLTYLKLSHRTLGLLINFHVALLKDGIVRMVNNFPET